MNGEIALESKRILSQRGARISLVGAFVYIAASVGTGLVVSYLSLNCLEYLGITISDSAAYAVMALFSCLFSAPAFAGMRSLCSAVCDGRETSFSELFISFSSFERFAAAYLGMLVTVLKYGIAVLILLLPEAVETLIFTEDENIPFYFYAITCLLVLVLVLAWFVLTAKLSRLFYYLHSKKMPFLKALRASYSGMYIVRGWSAFDMLNLLLSVATCFTFFIIQAGPHFAVEAEISMRLQDKYIKELNNEKSRKDGQDK